MAEMASDHTTECCMLHSDVRFCDMAVALQVQPKAAHKTSAFGCYYTRCLKWIIWNVYQLTSMWNVKF